ncbi:DUF421 domain-containing protein [Paenibacillus sp. P26]|nr:DUF421 domain-containing protein [Paenibacillus sp. P26]
MLEQLRKKSVFNVADVEFAILESSGELNVLLKKENQPLTAKHLGGTDRAGAGDAGGDHRRQHHGRAAGHGGSQPRMALHRAGENRGYRGECIHRSGRFVRPALYRCLRRYATAPAVFEQAPPAGNA